MARLGSNKHHVTGSGPEREKPASPQGENNPQKKPAEKKEPSKNISPETKDKIKTATDKDSVLAKAFQDAQDLGLDEKAASLIAGYLKEPVENHGSMDLVGLTLLDEIPKAVNNGAISAVDGIKILIRAGAVYSQDAETATKFTVAINQIVSENTSGYADPQVKEAIQTVEQIPSLVKNGVYEPKTAVEMVRQAYRDFYDSDNTYDTQWRPSSFQSTFSNFVEIDADGKRAQSEGVKNLLETTRAEIQEKGATTTNDTSSIFIENVRLAVESGSITPETAYKMLWLAAGRYAETPADEKLFAEAIREQYYKLPDDKKTRSTVRQEAVKQYMVSELSGDLHISEGEALKRLGKIERRAYGKQAHQMQEEYKRQNKRDARADKKQQKSQASGNQQAADSNGAEVPPNTPEAPPPGQSPEPPEPPGPPEPPPAAEPPPEGQHPFGDPETMPKQVRVLVESWEAVLGVIHGGNLENYSARDIQRMLSELEAVVKKEHTDKRVMESSRIVSERLHEIEKQIEQGRRVDQVAERKKSQAQTIAERYTNDPLMQDLIAEQIQKNDKSHEELFKYLYGDKSNQLSDRLKALAQRALKANTNEEIEAVREELEAQFKEIGTIDPNTNRPKLNEEELHLINLARDTVADMVYLRKLTGDPNGVRGTFSSEQLISLGFTDKDIKNLHALNNIDAIVASLSDPQTAEQAFEDFTNNINSLFNLLYLDLDNPANVNTQSDTLFDMLRHRPLQTFLYQRLSTISEQLRISQGENPNEVEWQHRDKSGRMVVERVPISKAISEMSRSKGKEHKVRMFTHDALLAMAARLGPEEVARFAAGFNASDFDVIMQDPGVSLAYNISEALIEKLLSDADFVISPTLMTQEGDSSFLSDAFYSRVKQEVRQFLKAQNGGTDPTQAEVDRAVNIGIGLNLVATGGILDWMASADPPSELNTGKGFTSYFAENLLKFRNPNRHFWWRWKAGDHELGITYITLQALMFKGGTFTAWEKDRLREIAKNRRDMRMVRFLCSATGIPIGEIANENSMGGIMTRAGWRMESATRPQLEGADNGRDINWDNVDWVQSWANLEKAGTYVMYFWSNALTKKDSKAMASQHLRQQVISWLGLSQKASDNDIRFGMRRKVYEYERKRDPLYFLRLDSPYRFYADNKNPAKGRFGTEKSDYKNENEKLRYKLRQALNNQTLSGEELTQAKIDEIEGDCRLISASLVQWEVGGIEDLNTDQIGKMKQMLGESRYNEAVRYWQAVQSLVTDGVIIEFSHQEQPFNYGSHGVNFKYVSFAQAGEHIVARAYGDEAMVAENVTKPYTEGFEDMLREVGAAHKDQQDAHGMKPLVEFLRKGYAAIKAVHGEDAAQEWVYRRRIQIVRYFDKSWWARIPGLGWATGLLGRESLSQLVGGKFAWAWDEGTKSVFDHEIEKLGLLDEHRMQRARNETGSRYEQVGFDVARQFLPLIIMLVIWSAAQKATEDNKN